LTLEFGDESSIDDLDCDSDDRSGSWL
jgi:hypothetical protein